MADTFSFEEASAPAPAAAAGPVTFSFEDAMAPAPKPAGAGRGSVNPPMVQPAGPDTTASDDAMRAGDPMGIVAQEQYKAPESTGSVFDNQDIGGPRMDAPTNDAAANERALVNARKSNPLIDKSPMYASGAGLEKADSLVAKGAVMQAKAEAERTKSSGSTAQDVALNLLGGFGGTVNKAGATISQAVGAEDAEAAFDSAAEMYKKMQADNGGGMLPGKVAGFVGSVAPAVVVGALLPASEAYVLLSNAGLFALPAFRDTLKEKLAAGQDFPLALAHASQSFGLNLFLPNIASKGGALLNNAAGKGIIGNAASAGAEGAGFSAATTVLDKGTDLVAGEKNEKNWLDLEDMGTMALGFGAMRGIHAGGAAVKDRMESPSQKFGRAFAEDVDAAGFNRAQPANLNPNLRDVTPKAADPVAEIFKTGSVEEAAAAAARAADVPLDGQDTAAALRSARPMRPKPVEPTEGALDDSASSDVSRVADGAGGERGDLPGAGVPDGVGTDRATGAAVDARGVGGEAAGRVAPVESTGEPPAAVETPRAEPFATKPEANMAALKEDAVAVPAEGGWTLQLKTRPYSDKEVAANEADIAAINDGLNHNNEARAEAGLPGDREPVRLLSTAPTAPMVVGRRIGRLLGVKVVFVEDHPGFSGVALRGVAYVSPQAKHPELAIIGHEVTHGILQRLRAEDPARAQALHEQLAAYVRQDAVDKKQAAEPDRSRKHAEEEVIADLNGSMWLDPKFWAEMRKADPSTFRKIAYAFMQAITKVTQNLSRFKAEDFTGDVDAVRKILAREMSQLAREEAVESHSPTEKQELGIKGKDATPDFARNFDDKLKERSAAQLDEAISALGRDYVEGKLTHDEHWDRLQPLMQAKIAAENREKSAKVLTQYSEVHPGFTEIPVGTKVMATHGMTYKEPQRATVVGVKHLRVGDEMWKLPKVQFDEPKRGDAFADTPRTLQPADIHEVFKPRAAEKSAEPKGAADEAAARGQEPMFDRKAPDTPEFKKWFEGSRVVDAKGEPLVVYHGTTADFNEFTPRIRKGEQLGFGIHLAEDPTFASKYASDENVARKGKTPQVMPVYLHAEKPLLADAVVTEGSPEFALAKKLGGSRLFTMKDEQGRQTAYLQNAIDLASPQRAEQIIRDAGYDAVRYESRIGGRGINAGITAKSRSWLVFEPEQLKSATGNNGKFDAKNPDIRFDRKEAEKPRKPGEVTREEARQMGDLRKKVKVLESLLECLGG